MEIPDGKGLRLFRKSLGLNKRAVLANLEPYVSELLEDPESKSGGSSESSVAKKLEGHWRSWNRWESGRVTPSPNGLKIIWIGLAQGSQEDFERNYRQFRSELERKEEEKARAADAARTLSLRQPADKVGEKAEVYDRQRLGASFATTAVDLLRSRWDRRQQVETSPILELVDSHFALILKNAQNLDQQLAFVDGILNKEKVPLLPSPTAPAAGVRLATEQELKEGKTPKA